MTRSHTPSCAFSIEISIFLRPEVCRPYTGSVVQLCTYTFGFDLASFLKPGGKHGGAARTARNGGIPGNKKISRGRGARRAVPNPNPLPCPGLKAPLHQKPTAPPATCKVQGTPCTLPSPWMRGRAMPSGNAPQGAHARGCAIAHGRDPGARTRLIGMIRSAFIFAPQTI